MQGRQHGGCLGGACLLLEKLLQFGHLQFELLQLLVFSHGGHAFGVWQE